MSNTENIDLNKALSIRTSIAPWLSVENSSNAVNFYKAAFGAIEVYKLETPDGGLVARLSVDGSEFWVSGGISENGSPAPESLGGGTIRMILTVADPDSLFTRALKAGATEIFPVGEDYGWRLGRVSDPFGLHWEIGHPLSTK
ncbi:MAG: VOC family protein [Ferruginibacter sp.]